MSTQSDIGAIPDVGVIPLCVPEVRGNEWKYIKECLDTGWVSSVGSYVDRFEKQLATYVGAKYGVACVNGTSAIHAALLVAGVERDDEVLISDLTFVAPANAIRYVGAHPVFIDVEPIYWQIDPQKVADFLHQECHWHHDALYNKTTGRRVKAIIPVHILGHPVDMDPIMALARQYNLVVIEDATESLGATYKGKKVGVLGDISCFSFNGNKIITTGSGGMIVTDNQQWAERAKYLTTQAKDDPVEYIHNAVGYNYRLTNIQAAMGCAQLELLDEYIAQKRIIAQNYAISLNNVDGLLLMKQAEWAESIFWMYTILVDPAITGITSRQLSQELKRNNILTRPLWCPMHLLPISKQDTAYQIEHSPEIYYRSLSLPCSVGLTVQQQQFVGQQLIVALKKH